MWRRNREPRKKATMTGDPPRALGRFAGRRRRAAVAALAATPSKTEVLTAKPRATCVAVFDAFAENPDSVAGKRKLANFRFKASAVEAHARVFF